jgi:ribosomal protein S18 acetylase RimI-like enzyme
MDYQNQDVRDIDMIAPLWEKQRQHHAERADIFKSFFEKKAWNDQKAELMSKARLETHTVSIGGVLKGYCVASIDSKGKGEIESLYLEPELRGKGIGAELFRRCLDWLEREGAENITIYVAAGNEEVLPFYEKLSFAPRAYLLKKKPEK